MHILAAGTLGTSQVPAMDTSGRVGRTCVMRSDWATASPSANVTKAVAYSRNAVFGTNTAPSSARRYPLSVRASRTSLAMAVGDLDFPATFHGMPVRATWGPASTTRCTVPSAKLA
eukprot:3712999-Pyramimonas_sp.AAC.1